MVLPVWLCLAACGDDQPMVAEATDSTSTTTGDPGSSSTVAASSSTTGSVDSTGADSTTGEPEIPPPPLPWTDECVFSGSDLSMLNAALECVGVEVPLDWDDPDSELITIAAFKVPTAAATRQGQIWLLDGGPGGSGLSFFLNEDITALGDAGWDILVPSHRGTLSPLVDCPNPAASKCRTALEDVWGDGLRHFNTPQAAHDLAELIARESQIPDDPVLVYGVSYGTMWAMYYGSLHPTQADGLILDSVLPAEVEILTQESSQQLSAEALLEHCIDDPACGPMLPYRDGAEFAAAVVGAIDDGDCGGQDDGVWLDTLYRDELGLLLNFRSRDYLPLLAALLAACTPEASQIYSMAVSDLISMGFGNVAQPVGPMVTYPRYQPGVAFSQYGIDPDLFSASGLQFVVMGTTILRDGEDPGPITEAARNNLVGLGFAGLFTVTHEQWTSLPDVAALPPFPADLPTLALAGRYDLQTPLSWVDELAESFAGEDQQLLVFDSSNHGVIGSSETATSDSCAREIIEQFALQPTGALDTSCMDDLPEIDPALERPDLLETSVSVFGTDDPWSLVPVPAP